MWTTVGSAARHIAKRRIITDAETFRCLSFQDEYQSSSPHIIFRIPYSAGRRAAADRRNKHVTARSRYQNQPRIFIDLATSCVYTYVQVEIFTRPGCLIPIFQFCPSVPPSVHPPNQSISPAIHPTFLPSNNILPLRHRLIELPFRRIEPSIHFRFTGRSLGLCFFLESLFFAAHAIRKKHTSQLARC